MQQRLYWGIEVASEFRSGLGHCCARLTVNTLRFIHCEGYAVATALLRVPINSSQSHVVNKLL